MAEDKPTKMAENIITEVRQTGEAQLAPEGPPVAVPEMAAWEDMALFMDSSPEDLSKNPDLAAIQALMYDDMTPQQIAEDLKNKANSYLKLGKHKFKEALAMYSDALLQNCGDAALESIILANRAHIHLQQQNYGRARADSEAAVKLNPDNIKAWYRAARAATAVGADDAAVQHCRSGLQRDPGNAELKKLMAAAEGRIEAAAAAAARAAEVKRQAKALASAILSRGVRLGSSLHREKTLDRRPWLDASKLVHWPVVLLYPEVMSSDVLEDVSEADMLRPHLAEVFSTPLPWDEERRYTLANVELYVQTNSSPPIPEGRVWRTLVDGKVGLELQDGDRGGEVSGADADQRQDWSKAGAKRWVKVGIKWTLSKALSVEGHVVPGVPVFYVVAVGTPFRELFLSGNWAPP